jgi:hypothetical protein
MIVQSAGVLWESRLAVRASNQSCSQRRDRLEKLWAWAALLMLLFCWDAASRLDQSAPSSRVSFSHGEAGE